MSEYWGPAYLKDHQQLCGAHKVQRLHQQIIIVNYKCVLRLHKYHPCLINETLVPTSLFCFVKPLCALYDTLKTLKPTKQKLADSHSWLHSENLDGVSICLLSYCANLLLLDRMFPLQTKNAPICYVRWDLSFQWKWMCKNIQLLLQDSQIAFLKW